MNTNIEEERSTIDKVHKVLDSILDEDEENSEKKYTKGGVNVSQSEIISMNSTAPLNSTLLFPKTTPLSPESTEECSLYNSPQLNLVSSSSENTPTPDLLLKLLKQGELIKLITSQKGSRYMQTIYKKINSENIILIFNEILPYLPHLMIDHYANYFCQKFYGILNRNQRIIFIQKISPFFVEISNSSVGTYPIQSIISQFLENEEKSVFLKLIYPKIPKIIINPNGVHVVEKIIEVYNDENLCGIYEIIIKYFLSLSTNVNGLFICKKMILKNRNPIYIDQLLNIFIQYLPFLIHKQYSNYTFQVAIETWNYKKILPLFYLLNKNFIEYACEKYSSNVIEKYLEYCSPNLLNQIVDTISRNNEILCLLRNPFGNYVLLKAIKLASMSDKIKLMISLSNNIEKISDCKYYLKWKYILSNLLKSLNNKNNSTSQKENNNFIPHNDNDNFENNFFFFSSKINDELNRIEKEYNFKTTTSIMNNNHY